MASNKPVDKLVDSLKGLVIGASGNIPGHLHEEIQHMVEECGATFERLKVNECTHLVTTESSVKRKLKKIDLASEEGCNIVNVEWLLDSIQKQTPENVQKYLLKYSKGGNAAIGLKGTKRDREDELGDEHSAASKKAKNERRENLKRLVGLVDETYPVPDAWLSVWLDDDGQIWDSTLVKFDKTKSQILGLRMQLLFHNASKTFHVWHFQYQPGSSNAQEQLNVGSPGYFASAKEDFLSKFKSFTGLSWDARYSDPLPDSWISLEMSHRDVPIITSEIVKLPEQVEKVLNIVFESSQLERYVAALNHQGRGVSVQNKLDMKKLQIGFAVLKKQIKLCASDSLEAKELAGIYQRLILGPNAGPLHDSREVRKELESLELLLKLQYASEILKSSGSSSMALSQISQVLGLAKMEPVDQTSTEFNGLREYLLKSSLSYHPSQFESVIGVFRLERPGEAERFAKWEKANDAHIGDRRLLWHGSPLGNFAGILSQGLRRDGIISLNGTNFCQGVFFADVSTKSAGYCRAVPQAEVLMLLCEVELGKSSKIATRKTGKTNHNKWRDAGYIHPDFRGFKVPDVHGGTANSTRHSVFFNSEYIAHDPAQVIQRYLFHIKLK